MTQARFGKPEDQEAKPTAKTNTSPAQPPTANSKPTYPSPTGPTPVRQYCDVGGSGSGIGGLEAGAKGKKEMGGPTGQTGAQHSMDDASKAAMAQQHSIEPAVHDIHPSPSPAAVQQPDQPSIIISSSPSPSKGKRGASPTELPIKDKMGVLKLSKRPSIKRVQGQRGGDEGESESSDGHEGLSGVPLARVREGERMQSMQDVFIPRSLPPGLAPP